MAFKLNICNLSCIVNRELCYTAEQTVDTKEMPLIGEKCYYSDNKIFDVNKIPRLFVYFVKTASHDCLHL